jgi:hypothetical protein
VNTLKLIGKVAQDRGREGEERIFIVMNNNRDKLPIWVKGVRFATKEEDRLGYDIVINTSYGVMYFQIKSSRTGAIHYKERYVPSNVKVIISKPSLTEENILNIVNDKLYEMKLSVTKKSKRKWIMRSCNL